VSVSLLTWVLEHHPQSRMNRVIYDAQQDGVVAGFRSLKHETIGFGQDAVFAGSLLLSRGGSLVMPNNITAASLGTGIYYDPDNVDFTSFGVLGYYMQQQIESRSQDEKSRPSGRPVKPKTLRGNSKPSRPASSGQTSKPFWANGKPKCKKGFRYDFKRKLCVKIK
jgi:hypothetical protein